MTRNEAKRKVEKICGLPLGQDNIVDALEALGLLKFDEVKVEYSDKLTPQSIIRNKLCIYTSNPSSLAQVIINDLLKAKYRIVDSEKCYIVDKEIKATVSDGPLKINDSQQIINLGSTYRVCIKQGDNVVRIEGAVISLSEIE